MHNQRQPSLRAGATALASAALFTSVLTYGLGSTPTPVAAVATTAAACPDGSDLVEIDPAICVVVFTAGGTFTPPADVATVDVVVVGGGGGGAQGGVIDGQVLAGGGGGGGAVVVQTGVAVSDVSPVTVTIGAGGAGGVATTVGVAGADGGQSSFGLTTADGGTGGTGGAAGPAAGAGGASGNSNLGGISDGTNFGIGSVYFSGGGGGGGAGGAGGAGGSAEVTCHDGDEDLVSPLTTDWVCGGDGGKGLLPTGGSFTSAFWTEWGSWQVAQAVTTYGFGPGGAGAVVGLWRDNGTTPFVYWASGYGVDLTGAPLGRGSLANGADAWALNVSPGAPGVPDRSSSAAFGWGSTTYGGGGSGGTGGGDGVTSNLGTAGTAGIVIVTFPAGEVTTVASTTTYDGTSGTITAGDIVELSATVAPTSGEGTCDTEGLLTYFLVIDDGVNAPFDQPIDGISLDTEGFEPGTYTIKVKYAGDGTCLPSEGTGTFTIEAGVESTTTYIGPTGNITAGTTVNLTASVSPDTCDTEGLLFYLITDPIGNDIFVEGTTLDTTGAPNGIYQVQVYYDGDGTCLSSESSGTFTIVNRAPIIAGSTTGSGTYEVDSHSHNNNRVQFDFSVKKTEKFDRRSGIRRYTQRGQLMWTNNNQWRLKASLSANWSTKNGETMGDMPVFGVTPCPEFVGTEDSEPKCGTISGYGLLEYWDKKAGKRGAWVPATQFGDGGWVSFSANIGDGGSEKVCKKKRCTTTDLADWFGLSIDGVDIEDGVPVSDPVPLPKQRKGGIVISS